MKTTLLFLLLFVIAGTAALQAQIIKGSTLLGGNLSFGNSKGEYENSPNKVKSSSYHIAPSVGVAVEDNLIAGISLGYQYDKSFNGGNGAVTETSTNRYTAGAYIRKYKQLGKSDFYLFGEGNIYFNASKQKQESEDVIQIRSRINNIGVNFKPGVSYAVNRWLHLELGMNDLFNAAYSYRKDQGPDVLGDFKARGFSVSSSVSNLTNALSFGLRFLLAK